MKAIHIFPFLIFCFFTIEGFTKPLSPLDFGLKEAQTNIERYEVLLLTHTKAAKLRKAVSYKGIKQINIEIPKDGRSIPLSYKTDFAGVNIEVDKERPYLISADNPGKLSVKSPKALAKACWPDVNIKKLTVNLPEGTNNRNVFQLRGGTGTKMYGITKIDIDGLIINGDGNSPKVRVSNFKMDFDRQISVRVKNSSIELIEN